MVRLMSHEETKMSLYSKRTSAQLILIAGAPLKPIALCQFTAGEDQALCLQEYGFTELLLIFYLMKFSTCNFFNSSDSA